MSALKEKFRYYNHAWVDAMRDLRRVLMKALFGRPFRALPSSGEIKKILVLRLDRKLGDSVASTGFLRALHEGFPHAEITVLTAPQTAAVYETFDFLKVIPVAKGMGPSLKISKQFKNEIFDVLIDTSHLISPKVIHLAGSIKARRKIAFKNSNYRLFSDHVEFDEEYDHITLRYQKTLELLGVRGKDLSYEIRIPEENKKRVDQALKEKGDPKYIVINSFAGAQMRNLREPTTKALLQKLHEKFPKHLLVSIANQGDMNLLKVWKAGGDVEGWIFFPELTGFFDNCRLIEKADLVISADTAVIHMACAFKTPLVGIYRAETVRPNGRPLNWDPYGTEYKIVESLPEPEKNEQDINNVRLEEVIEASLGVLMGPA